MHLHGARSEETKERGGYVSRTRCMNGYMAFGDGERNGD